MNFIYYLFLFYIYSIIGWIAESFYVAIRNKKFIDRGFLIGPYCPIYGSGAIIIINYLTQYQSNPLTIFLLGALLCSILEYSTSFIMEKLFNARWWDYSQNKYNLNGRICIKNSILFGLGSLAVIYLSQPLITKIFPTTTKTLLIITIIISFIFILDLITSLQVVSSFKKTIKNINYKKDSTQEFTNLVKETLQKNKKIFQKRLYAAYPNIDLSKLINLKNDLKEIKDDIKSEIIEIKDDIKEKLKK